MQYSRSEVAVLDGDSAPINVCRGKTPNGEALDPSGQDLF
jgi:hypothetical protein